MAFILTTGYGLINLISNFMISHLHCAYLASFGAYPVYPASLGDYLAYLGAYPGAYLASFGAYPAYLMLT